MTGDKNTLHVSNVTFAAHSRTEHIYKREGTSQEMVLTGVFFLTWNCFISKLVFDNGVTLVVTHRILYTLAVTTRVLLRISG